MWSSQHDHERRIRRRKGHRAPALRRRGFRPRLEGLEDRTVLSTLTVPNTLDSGAGSLRDAIKAASSGDTIVFDPGLNGQTITLTSDELTISKSLDIEGPGAGPAGHQRQRCQPGLRHQPEPKPVTVTIAGLTIANGRAPDGGGGGIHERRQHAERSATTSWPTTRPSATPSTGPIAAGGAIANRNGGDPDRHGLPFIGNQAIGSDGGGPAWGGAIDNAPSTASVTGSTFTGNRAIGGDGGVVTNGAAYLGDGGAAASQQLRRQPHGPGQHVHGQPGHRRQRRQRRQRGQRLLYEVDLGGGGAIQDFDADPGRWRMYVHRQPGHRRLQRHRRHAAARAASATAVGGALKATARRPRRSRTAPSTTTRPWEAAATRAAAAS